MNIIKTYQNKEVVETFDKEREKFEYQRDKHRIESSFLMKSLFSGAKVLDVGCGTGRMLEPCFRKQSVEYYGADTSMEMMNVLKSKVDDLNVKVSLNECDAREMPFDDNTFDVVFSYHLLWHLPKDDQERVISEMFRVVKEGGVVIFDIINKNFILSSKDKEGLYKMSKKEIMDLIGYRHILTDKLNDIPVNDFVYCFLGAINRLRAFLPSSLFHMVYFKVLK